MTDPLVDPATDLRDFAFMPVDIGRLFGSEFHAQSDDAAWRAGMTLWLKSYHQVPASSIPDDDIALARLAELGRDLKTWKKIKAAALRGWVKCSDGRLYHPVVAEKALEGWIEKLTQRKSSAAGNAKKYNQVFDPVPFDDAIESSRARLAALNPQSRILSKRSGRYAAGAPGGSKLDASNPPDGSPDDLPTGSQEKGQGREGKGILEDNQSAQQPLPAAAPPNSDFDQEEIRGRCEKAAGGRSFKDFQTVIDLIEAGVSLDRRILPIIRDVAAKRPGRDDIASWKFFAPAIRDNARPGAPASCASLQPPLGTYIKAGTPEWESASVAYRKAKGRGPPIDNGGGWLFLPEFLIGSPMISPPTQGDA